MMTAVVSFIVLLMVVAVPFMVIAAIMSGRRDFLAQLTDLAARGGLVRVAGSRFDVPPTSGIDEHGGARVEGKRAGESIAVRARFPPERNGNYMRRGYKDMVAGEISVITGLGGATPKLSIRPKGSATAANLATDLGEAFTIDAEPDLLDDATKELIMAFIRKGPTVHAITIDGEGLVISIEGSAGQTRELMTKAKLSPERLAEIDATEGQRIEETMDFALALEKRIIAALDRRGTAHVRVAAYREPNAAAELEEEDAPDSAAAGVTRER